MFSSSALEVAIGMAFIYLLLSLFCTAINEGFAGILGSRARNLERGIRALFSEGSLPSRDNHGVVERDEKGRPKPGLSLTSALYAHGLVEGLYQSGAGQGIVQWWGGGKRLPSYIPARTFGCVMIDLLFPTVETTSSGQAATATQGLDAMVKCLDELPESKAKEALLALVRQANGEILQTRRAFENWFNDGMDRVSGWYKRKTQLVLFCLGFGLAVTLNIDSISLGRALWTNPALRSYAVTAANEYANANPLHAGEAAGDIPEPLHRLEALALPIGWNSESPMHWRAGHSLPQWSSPQEFIFALVGWLLTAIAMTLGAPFWFDTLNRFMVVRSTIKPREKSEVERSKDPAVKS